MDFNTIINEHINGEFPVIEDVVLDYSFDGTSCHVTLCGKYGQELSEMTISVHEIDSLQNTITDVNYVTD
jgi:hypothetical protein